jgi:hypothetical protein
MCLCRVETMVGCPNSHSAPDIFFTTKYLDTLQAGIDRHLRVAFV